jgi:hypothetical protein
LNVWPTVSPKSSLTSQKPASFTCERNSEPAPIARASRAAWAGVSELASGAAPPTPSSKVVVIGAGPALDGGWKLRCHQRIHGISLVRWLGRCGASSLEL